MSPHAYRWQSDTRLEGLGDLAEEAPIGNLALRTRQTATFEKAGFTVQDIRNLEDIREKEFLLFADNLWVTPALLKMFLKKVREQAEQEGCWQMALVENAWTRITQFTKEQKATTLEDGQKTYAFRLFYVRLNQRNSLFSALEAATRMDLKPWCKDAKIPFSARLPSMTDMVVPVTDAFAIELTSWVHLWIANLASVGLWFLELLRTPMGLLWLLPRVFWAILTAFSLSPFKILVHISSKLVLRGRGCKIHPTAVVEGCILGKNVQIGPLAVVRASILGDNVQIMEQALVDGSVLGDNTIVNQQGMIKICVTYPDAVFNWMQAGLVGRRTFLGILFRPLDMKFQGTVRILHKGRLVDTGLPFLGVGIGHRAFFSAESRVHPGRFIPNDYKILSNTDRWLDKIPEDLPTDGFLYDRDGQLEPFRKSAPQRNSSLADTAAATEAQSAT